MIIYKQGNLLDIKEGIIAHGCNTQGVMGSGVARAVKAKYPDAYYSYLDHLNEGYSLGTVDFVQVTSDLIVANCITQSHYGTNKDIVYVKYNALRICLDRLVTKPQQLHIPKIGAGLANGDWNVISGIINSVYTNREVICWEL